MCILLQVRLDLSEVNIRRALHVMIAAKEFDAVREGRMIKRKK